MANTGYFIDSISGQHWYRCLQCKYDVFNADSIRAHVRTVHSLLRLPEEDVPIEDWITSYHGANAHRIGITLLTWNTKDASLAAAHQIRAEQIRLRQLGVEVSIFWADNGSTDGTVETLTREFDQSLAAKLPFSENIGQSRARNSLVTAAKMADCDQVLMVDGDIEIVPWSAFAMSQYLDTALPSTACIGMYCRNCSHLFDEEVATECRRIDPWMVSHDPPISWTNYGMYRIEALDRCWFEDQGPFDGPGWGFEDDDHYLQLISCGYGAVNTKYFRHMHRRRHSSVRLLGNDLAAKMHAERKAFLVNKWRNSPAPGIQHFIARLENQTMPVMEY